MREAINFIFNDIPSEDMGVHIISNNRGLFNEQLLPTRKIIETKTPYRIKPDFQGVDYEPLSFPLRIYIDEWKERDNLRQIARWLFQDYYKPLVFDTNLDRIYYAMFIDNPSLVHNGAKEGYIDLNVRCNSPFTYSYIKTEEVETEYGEGLCYIYNEGDLKIKPKMTIKKKLTAGDIFVENETTKQTAKLSNLGAEETVFIDFERQDIISSHEETGVYRYDDFNNVWLDFCNTEENIIKITGDCDIEIEYQMIYLAD